MSRARSRWPAGGRGGRRRAGTLVRDLVVVGASLALCQAAVAQQPPTGGSLLPPPAVPSLPPPVPEMRIAPSVAPAAADAAPMRVLVRTLRITGAELYSEAELLAVARFAPGSQLSLADLQEMVARITAHYRSHGYFVAQAYLPAQDIRDETVTLAVTEGRLGKVELRNATNLSDRVARNSLDRLHGGDPIATGPFETQLLLLSDVPGVNVRSTLVPGAAAGTSDLYVDVLPGQRVTGSIDVDNAGNRYTGAWRIGGTVNVNNPLGLGDVASLRVLTSGHGLRYARASYQLQAGRGQLGVAYSRLDYALGREFAALGAHGTADIASVYGRYPLVRSRDNNVYLQLALDAKRFEDVVDSVPSVTKRNAQVLMASIHGDHRDTLGGGGVNLYSVTVSGGNLDIETPAARAADAATARTNGQFGKLGFSLLRLQNLGGPFSLQAGLSGQLASKNLDVSEKIELGGMNAVRAYPEGEAYADEGLLATLEGRMLLAGLAPHVPGQVQLVAFVDAGTVKLNKDPWTGGTNRRTLTGAGVGVNWALPGNFLVRAYYARRLGHALATSAPDRSGRFWLQAIKYF